MSHNVLHLLGTAQPQGTAMVRLVTSLASRLDPQRFRVHAWFLGEDGPLAAQLRQAGAEVHVISWSRGIRDPLAALRFWRALRRNRFKIVHQHYGGRAVSGLVRIGSRAALLVHLHGRVLEAQGATPVSARIPPGAAVIAVSRSVARQVQNAQVRVVYTGVEIPTNTNQAVGSESGYIIGAACRLVPIKAVVFLIRAVARLRHEFPGLRLEIAGDGPERAPLEEEARSLGIADAVSFLGWQMDLAPLFARWHVFVQSSLEEGLPIALLEAMAAGVPAVATAVGGTPEVIQDGETGWLVPSQDADALAARVRDLLRSPEQRRAMGAAARTRVQENFSADRMVTELTALYDRLAKFDPK
jgi:glycosyltransferase involved in cell wall biosynthesis